MQLTRVNVGLRPEVFERLGERAAREGRPVAAMAARLIEQGLPPAADAPARVPRGPYPSPPRSTVAEVEQAPDEPVVVRDPEFAQ